MTYFRWMRVFHRKKKFYFSIGMNNWLEFFLEFLRVNKILLVLSFDKLKNMTGQLCTCIHTKISNRFSLTTIKEWKYSWIFLSCEDPLFSSFKQTFQKRTRHTHSHSKQNPHIFFVIQPCSCIQRVFSPNFPCLCLDIFFLWMTWKVRLDEVFLTSYFSPLLHFLHAPKLPLSLYSCHGILPKNNLGA